MAGTAQAGIGAAIGGDAALAGAVRKAGTAGIAVVVEAAGLLVAVVIWVAVTWVAVTWAAGTWATGTWVAGTWVAVTWVAVDMVAVDMVAGITELSF